MTAKQLQAQLTELGERISSLETDLSARTDERDALAAKLEELNGKLATVELQLQEAKTTIDEQAKALAAEQEQVATLEAEQASAEAKAGQILASIGVPPVEEPAVTQAAAQTKEELWREYESLLKTNPKAAGQLYHEKIRPMIFKEN